ncbi:glycosyltransferase [Planctomycetota bacterium]
MKIFFTNAFFPSDRYEGARVHIEQLTKNIENLGHEVWTLPISPLSYGNKLSQNRRKRLTQIMSTDVFYTRIQGATPRFPCYFRYPWKLLFNKPLVWEINATPDLRLLGSAPASNSDIKATEGELRQWAKQVRVAICNTDGLVQYARDLGIKYTRRIELGSDPDFFSPQAKRMDGLVLPDNKLNILWCGNSSIGWHDFDTILKAATKLRQQPGIRFYIIGSLPSTYNVPDNITILGNIPYKEMPSCMSVMDVGLAIYRENTWSRYGVFSSPLKLFDYCASGLLVVTSPIEQVQRCIVDNKNGFIIPFGDYEALAKCLLYIMKNKSKLKKTRVRARSMIVKYYNWQRVAQETVETISTHYRHCSS